MGLTVDKLEFYTTDEGADAEHGRYWIYKADRDWCARYFPHGAEDDAVELHAVNEDGELIDWPTKGSAEEICGAHSRLVREGQSPELAAKAVLEFSREYLIEKQARRELAQPEPVQLHQGINGHAAE